MTSTLDDASILRLGQDVIEAELTSLQTLKNRIDNTFVEACRMVLATNGRVIVVGMGKSGHIANKIASTLASTGTPAFFVHPAEASHGDLGMITSSDLLLALTNSGETPEILTILPVVKRIGVPVIVMTGNLSSTVAEQANVVLDTRVEHEACPHDLAPTSSSICMLAMGDAIALALLTARGFTPEDFARAHPGGALGRRLLLYVGDIMLTGEQIPRVDAHADMRKALVEMTSKSLGMTAVEDETGRLVGIFTDGDLRRCLESGIDIYAQSIEGVMTQHPVTVGASALAAEVLKLMQERRINGIIVVDNDRRITGALNNQTLLLAGIL